ncbi:MAG: SMI1/KNR4 family protein [Hydrogenophaga sp.]|nr:SMI1/KNR4 family protein [Hydrogenophaga sp.]
MRPELPAAYVSYLLENGAFEGNLSKGPPFDGESSIVLFGTDEIDQINDDYQLDEYAAGFLAFGSNGGGELYVFDSAGAVYVMPEIGMEPGAALLAASNFPEFAKRINR